MESMHRNREVEMCPGPYDDYAYDNVARMAPTGTQGFEQARSDRAWTHRQQPAMTQIEAVAKRYQGSQSQPERQMGAQTATSPAGGTRLYSNVVDSGGYGRACELSPANSFVGNLMARARMGQENYGGRGLADIHPDYVRSQMGYPPAPPSRVNRLDPAGLYADEGELEAGHLNPTSEAEVVLGSPLTAVRAPDHHRPLLNRSYAPQHQQREEVRGVPGHAQSQLHEKHEMSSIRQISHLDGDSQEREAQSVLQEITGREAPASQPVRAPQEVGLKQVIRRSGSRSDYPDREEERGRSDQLMVPDVMRLAPDDDGRRQEWEHQVAGARTVRFAEDEDSGLITFAPAGQRDSDRPQPGLRKSQSQNMPLQIKQVINIEDQEVMSPESNYNDHDQFTSRADVHGLENVRTRRRGEVSSSTQELQRQLQELRHRQYLRFPGNSPSRGHHLPAQSSPREGQSASNAGSNQYDDYYSKYYERQKQQQAFRSLNHQFAVNQQRSKAEFRQPQQSYCPEQASSIGLGQPQNLAAFDLPLSSRMSREVKGSCKKGQQGQGGSVADPVAGSQERKCFIVEGETPRQQADVASGRPSYLIKDGGQQRVEELGNQMRLSGLLLPESDPEASARKAQMSARVYQETPVLDQNRRRAHRNSQGDLSGWKSSRTSYAGGSTAQASAMNLKVLPRKLSPAQAMSQGNRLHAIHRTHQLKKAHLREELDRELQEQMRDKPQINQKSREMIEDRDRAAREQEQPPNDFVKRNIRGNELNNAFLYKHHECLKEAHAKMDEERRQCTHRPKINRKSRTLIENRILQNLQRKAELYKMHKNPMYRMSQEGILLDMPATNRPQANQINRESPSLKPHTIQIQPNKYQIPLNKEAVANKSPAPQSRSEIEYKGRTALKQAIKIQNSSKDDWKRVAVEQLMQNDSRQSQMSHLGPHRFDQHSVLIDQILNSATDPERLQELKASRNDNADLDLHKLHPYQHGIAPSGEAQGPAPQKARASKTDGSNLVSIEQDSESGMRIDQAQTFAGTIGSSNRNINMPRMLDTHKNPVINLQSLQKQSAEKARSEHEQLYAGSKQRWMGDGGNEDGRNEAALAHSLPTFQQMSAAKTPLAMATDSNRQFFLPDAREQLFDQVSREESDLHAKSQKSLRQRIDERILKSKQAPKNVDKQAQFAAKKSSKPSIDAIVRGRSRGSSRASQRLQTAKSISGERRERSASRQSDRSSKSKRLARPKTKNFIILNAKQLARVQSSLVKNGQEASTPSKPNLFEQKKIKIKKQQEKSRALLTQRSSAREQRLAMSYENGGDAAASSREQFRNNNSGSLAKLKRNADLNKEIQLERTGHSNTKIQRTNSDFYKKNVEWRSRIEQRIIAEKEKRDLDELNECSFTPRIARAGPAEPNPQQESATSGSQRSQRRKQAQVPSPKHKGAARVDNIHYADYHKFRAEAAPRTYRELRDYQREVSTYLEKKTPQVQLRTERREQERQKSKAGSAADQTSKSEQTTPRPPLPNSSRTRQGEKDSDFGISTFRANNKLQESALFQVSLRSQRNADTKSSRQRFQTQSAEYPNNNVEDGARRRLHEEIKSIPTSPRDEDVIRGSDLLAQRGQARAQRGGVEDSPVIVNIQEQPLQATANASEGQSHPFTTRNSKEPSQGHLHSEEAGTALPYNDCQYEEVGQKVRRLGSLYMQRSAQEAEARADCNNIHSNIQQFSFDEQVANPGKIMLETHSSGPRNAQAKQGAREPPQEYVPVRNSRELLPPASGRSHGQGTPRLAESYQPSASSRHSARQPAANSNDAKQRNPSSFDNASFPIASTHRESAPSLAPFVPTPRTATNNLQTRHSEVQSAQHILSSPAGGGPAINTARNQVSGPFPYEPQRTPSAAFPGLQQQQPDATVPPEEFTLSQPARASYSDVAHQQPRHSTQDHSSMKSLDWQVSQTSGRRDVQALATPESFPGRQLLAGERQQAAADPTVDDNQWDPRLAAASAQFDLHQRYGGYAVPIQEKESEHAQSMKGGFGSMGPAVSASEYNSQYDFLQHVNSIKDRQSHVAALDDAAQNDGLRVGDPRLRAREIGVPPRSSDVSKPDNNSYSQSPIERADLYRGLSKDLALMQLRSSLVDKSLEFSREAHSDVQATISPPATKQNSLTTMSLEVNRQNREVERIKDEVKRWNQLQAMAGATGAQYQREQPPASTPMSQGYQSYSDYLGPSEGRQSSRGPHIGRRSDRQVDHRKHSIQ